MRHLVVAPHPDDETLGCGGSILRWCAEGDDVQILLITKTTAPQWSSEQMSAKKAEVARVAEAYRPATLNWLDLPSSRLDAVPLADVIQAIREVVEPFAPDGLYVSSPDDVHSDHRRVWEAVIAIAKPFRLRGLGVRRVAAYETLSSTDAMPTLSGQFRANIYYDITDYIDQKLEILSTYASELHDGLLPRTPEAVRAQGRLHGATVGLGYAERFSLIWEVL